MCRMSLQNTFLSSDSDGICYCEVFGQPSDSVLVMHNDLEETMSDTQGSFV